MAMGWLEGQVALVSGGGSGIGRGIVARFIAEGACVGVLERVPERIEQLQAAFGEYVLPVQGDVTRFEDNKRAVEQTVRAFGQLDIFVGNVGVFDRYMSLVDLPEDKLGEAFDEQFAVNVKGCLLGAKAELLELLKTEGCMVFTASVAGFNSGGGGVLYTAPKHAVVGLIRQLAVELAPKVRVNGVAQGGVQTDLRGLAALGQSEESHWAAPGIDWEERLRAGSPLQVVIRPQDLASAYVLLASRGNARTMTGVIIHVDAGSSLRMPRRS
jgi:NAD(P)-dependent dehydrogenase (short-subunit alcohol dehydrogenase family)